MPGKAAAIYHVVYARETFEHVAQTLLKLVRKTQEVTPGAPRLLYLAIEGHRNSLGGFDADMLELQRKFLIDFLMPFLSEVSCPLFQAKNPKPQINDVPATLQIEMHAGS